ncbi:hypothetical protein SSX86_030070 [Deinandra increscens subsp. villosa]|uniref:Folylpoly-gamma-glutamate synthetase n=1 Tax=Deinandra increscens subsp. villosa TaxID=3103831 RepID=A0AAP0CCJ1_9ASTR
MGACCTPPSQSMLLSSIAAFVARLHHRLRYPRSSIRLVIAISVHRLCSIGCTPWALFARLLHNRCYSPRSPPSLHASITAFVIPTPPFDWSSQLVFVIFVQSEKCIDDIPMPNLFCFLAFKTFTAEQVDVAVMEVGLGGKFDATNVVQTPILCGIASLGYDHTEILGNTLVAIAGEKAGILKKGVPAFTVPQPDEGMEVLKAKASQLYVIYLSLIVRLFIGYRIHCPSSSSKD